MQTIGYARPSREPKWRKRFLISITAIFSTAVLAIVLLYVSIQQTGGPTPTKTVPMGVTVSTGTAGVERFDSAAVFKERIDPVLHQLRKNNDEAVKRAIAKIHGHFDHARSGAPEFAESIIGPLDGVKTTYLAGKGVFFRWWYEDQDIQPVRNHVKWNYEQYVTSGPKLKEAIVDAIGQLEQDFQANRNGALQAIGSSLRAAHLPASVEVDEKQLDEFCQNEFEAAMVKLNSGNVAENAAVGSAAALAVSTVVTFIIERAVMYVIGDMVAAAGGSVATGTAGGAAAGSWVPGAGTIIGGLAGFSAGIAVDVWLGHRNKVKTIEAVTKSLTGIEDAIITGNGESGMQQVLNDAGAGQAERLAFKLKAQLTEASR